MSEKFPKRKPTRLVNFDYNTEGAYFLTICTENKQKILCDIVGGDVLDAPETELMRYGEIAENFILQLNDFYTHINVDRYVIMPNHIHIMLRVLSEVSLYPLPNGASRTSPPTNSKAKQHSFVSQFVSTFKRFCNKELGKNIWQRNFNDHIIRDQSDYETHLKYIEENPMRWEQDELF